MLSQATTRTTTLLLRTTRPQAQRAATLHQQQQRSVSMSTAGSAPPPGEQLQGLQPMADDTEKQQQPPVDTAKKAAADPEIDMSLAHTALEKQHPTQLLEERNKVLWEQATRGEQPGLMLMQDQLSGQNKAKTWGIDVPEKPQQQN